jgi:hypothetical protein
MVVVSTSIADAWTTDAVGPEVMRPPEAGGTSVSGGGAVVAGRSGAVVTGALAADDIVPGNADTKLLEPWFRLHRK